ncbi:hypothetical protein C8J57DRAFT_1527377 [Mycena rebaudengoi]|nr:hypothetical protein C8J57DRAFT_1527377 [Mycena rebaudengoi]
MHVILPAGLPVQELWDLIIDEILSKKDMQSCSLVCRSFVHTVVRAIELASLLATSPHIIPHIRHLTLGACNPNTHLESISFGLHVSSAVDFHRIPNLVCLSSLREVVFRGKQWKTEDIVKILSHCTQYLARVEFFECGRAAAGVPLVSQCRTPKIRRLYFKDSAMPGTLINYPLPWDLSAFTHVRVSRSMHGLKSFMLQVRSTIESLHLDVIDHGIESLDLSIFPVLKCLTSDSIGRSFNTMVTSLAPNNTIDTICICIRWFGQIPQLVQEFQKTFISLKLPVLRHMEVEVAPEALYFHYNAAELRKRFQRHLSQIRERGLLSEHFVAANRKSAGPQFGNLLAGPSDGKLVHYDDLECFPGTRTVFQIHYTSSAHQPLILHARSYWLEFNIHRLMSRFTDPLFLRLILGFGAALVWRLCAGFIPVHQHRPTT